MALFEPNLDPGPNELRRFGTVYLPGFLLLAGAAAFRKALPAWIPPAAVGAACASFAAGRLAPSSLRPIFVALVRITMPAGWIFARVLTLFVFFLVITPGGFVGRIARRNLPRLASDRTAESYWTLRRQSKEPERWFRQY